MPKANISLDLDNLWSYLKVHGENKWKDYPSYLPAFVPLISEFLERHQLSITFFLVGKDLEMEENIPFVRSLSEKGHDFGNHSFVHEPWMERRGEEEIIKELKRTETLIEKVTGKRAVGFRGPGFSLSPSMLKAVHALGYSFDSSLFPMSLSSIARFVYHLSMKDDSKEEKEKRKNLFGKTSNLFYPLKPFEWKMQEGGLLELPVTTMPFLRFPIHLSYIIWLSGFSKKCALAYFRTALFLLEKTNTPLSLLLHPLDFLGGEDVKELSFFPGMQLSRSHKLSIANQVIEAVKSRFDLVSMSAYADELKKQPLRRMEKRG